MNSYMSFILIRRLLAVGLAAGAALFGHHVVQGAQEDAMNASLDRAEHSAGESHIKRTGDGSFAVDAGGTKVTVKGLPTAR